MKLYARTYSHASDMSDFFVELFNSFWILEEYFLTCFVAIYSVTAIDMNTLKFNPHYL